MASPPLLRRLVSVSRIFLISSAVVFGVTVVGVAAGYRLNVTASLPIGVYAMSPVHSSLRRGDLVTFTLPAPLRLHCGLGVSRSRSVALRGFGCVHEGLLRSIVKSLAQSSQMPLPMHSGKGSASRWKRGRSLPRVTRHGVTIVDISARSTSRRSSDRFRCSHGREYGPSSETCSLLAWSAGFALIASGLKT